MKVLGVRFVFCAVLPLALLGVTGGCASVSAPDPNAEGLLARVTEGPWRVDVSVKDLTPTLWVWAKGASKPTVENRVLLPKDLNKANGAWQIKNLDLQQGKLTVSLRYQPQKSTHAFQDKQFGFDLNASGQPLVHYRVATGRGGKLDWLDVDFVQRKALSCRNAPEANPDDCRAVPLVLTNEPVPNLSSIGSAEEYVPPIKMEVRY